MIKDYDIHKQAYVEKLMAMLEEIGAATCTG